MRLSPAWRLCFFAALLSVAGSAVAGLWIPRHLPRIHDEYAYLLQAETFASGRLSTPAHPLAPFFENPQILVEPTYNGKYLPGHALFIAAGAAVGRPIWGVWLENAVFAAALAWMLAVFLPLRWAALGTLLAILQLGLLNYWAQTFLVSPLAAAGGALVWGGAFAVFRRQRRSDGWLLGLGVVSLLATRPFEGGLACIVPAGMLAFRWLRLGSMRARMELLRCSLVPAGFVMLAGIMALACYNRAVTGDAFTPPYSLYEARYSRVPLFVWQSVADKSPPLFAHPSLAAFYESYVVPMGRQAAFDAGRWLSNLRELTINNLDWFLSLLALLGAVLGACAVRRRPWAALAGASFATCTLAFVLTSWFDVHYLLPALPLLLLLALHGLRSLAATAPLRRVSFVWIAAGTVSAVCVLLAFNKQYERSAAYHRRTTDRQRITDALSVFPHRFLVIVRHEEPYKVHATYVWNPPDIDNARIVWAWDRGETENRRLFDYYRDRDIILMRVSAREMSFLPYQPPSP
jgi:hypothetical protein